jgi:membrane dipeptidase
MSRPTDDSMVEMTEPGIVSDGSQVSLHGFDHTLDNGNPKETSNDSHAAPKKNSLCYDIFMPSLVIVLLVTGIIVILVANNWRANDPKEIAKIYHEKHPFIDGKNQLPYAIKALYKGNLENLKLTEKQESVATDMPRMREGKLGGVVWAASHPCGLLSGNEGPTAVERTLYQMDIIHRLVQKYSNNFELVENEEKAAEAFAELKQLPSVISLEGGHQIHEDLGVLRMYYKLGAVSMALTSECSTAWSETGNPFNTQHTSVHGLTDFGLTVIEEMNRIGMMVDVSHTSVSVMSISLEKSKAPVIFSLSGAKALCNSSFNIPDELFSDAEKNGAVVMVPFFPPAICQWASTLFESYRSGAISLASMIQLYNESPEPCGVDEVFAHIDYLRTKLGVKHVGISTNFDSPFGLRIRGLEDVSKILDLTARFVQTGYSEADVTRIIGGNYLHAWSIAEEVSREILAEEGFTLAPSGGIFGI